MELDVTKYERALERRKTPPRTRMMSSRENRGLERGSEFEFGVSRFDVESSDEDEDFLAEPFRDRMLGSAIMMKRENLFSRVYEPDLGLLKPFELSDI